MRGIVMHSALFVVQISENRGTWLSFLAEIKSSTHAHSQMFHA